MDLGNERHACCALFESGGSRSCAAALIAAVRVGISSVAVRERLWLWGSGGEALRTEGRYSALRTRVASERSEIVEQIDRDVGRSGLGEDEDALKVPLRNVLVSYALRNAVVGYCQGLNFVVALCLKLGLSEESAFWILAGIVEMPGRDYYGAKLEGLLRRVSAIELLLDEELPAIAAVLRGFDTMPTQRGVLSQMLAGCLTATLPDAHMALVWDLALLVRGCTAARARGGERGAVVDVALNLGEELGLDDVMCLEFYAGLSEALEMARNSGDADQAVMVGVSSLRRIDEVALDAMLVSALARLAALRVAPKAARVREAMREATRRVAAEAAAHAAATRAMHERIAAARVLCLHQLVPIERLLLSAAAALKGAQRGDWALLRTDAGICGVCVADAAAATRRVLAATASYQEQCGVGAKEAGARFSGALTPALASTTSGSGSRARAFTFAARPPSESLRQLQFGARERCDAVEETRLLRLADAIAVAADPGAGCDELRAELVALPRLLREVGSTLRAVAAAAPAVRNADVVWRALAMRATAVAAAGAGAATAEVPLPRHPRDAIVALMLCKKLRAELRGADAQRLLRSVNGIGGAHLGAICAELDSVALRLRNYVAHSPRCGAAEHWASGVAEVERAQSAAWIEEGASVALLPTIGAFAAAGATFAKSQFALAVHRVLSRVALVAEQVFILADALPMFREVESEKTLSVVLARTLAEHRTKMVVARRVGLVLQKLEQAKLVVQRRRGSSGGAGAPALSAEALVAAQAELAAAEPLLRDLPDPRWRVALSEQLALLRAQLA